MASAVRRARGGDWQCPWLSPRTVGRHVLRRFGGRVALCFGTYPPERNGGADFVSRLAGSLVAEGAEPHVLTSAADAPTSVREGGVTVHRVVRDWRLTRSNLGIANHVLRENGIEVVHVLFPDSVLQGAYQLPAAVGLGRTPLVATWWNLGLGRRSPATIRLQSLALLARTKVVTSHDPTALGVLRTAAFGRPVEWLPVGNNLVSGALGDRERERRALGLAPGARWIGYFGQLDRTRGVEDLFGALALARRECDVRLVMIGSAGRPERYASDPSSDAYLRASLALPDTLGVGDAVLWTDYLSDVDVARYLRAIELCVLPYRRNSLGRSALAAAFDVGAPTVLAGSREGIAPLRAGEHVALVPPADRAVLAATIVRVLGDDEERRRLGEGARAAAAFFAWPRVAHHALRIYELAR